MEKNTFSLGVFLVGLSFFGLFVNEFMNKVPSYSKLSIVKGEVLEIKDWSTRARYNTHSGVDIIIQGKKKKLRIGSANCRFSLAFIMEKDIIKIMYEKISLARIDGKAYEIRKNNNILCDFNVSSKKANVTYKDWWPIILFSPLIGLGLIIYAVKTKT